MTKQHIPKIRFQGFDDEWEERQLKQLTDYKNGKGYEKKQKENGKYELVNLNSILITGGLKSSGKFIDMADDILEKNDLVMILSDVGRGDLLGRVALIPEDDKFVLNQRVALLRPNSKTIPYFLFTYINRYQSYFKKNGAGMSQLNISKGIVENFFLSLPTLPEQESIGQLFLTLDELISAYKDNLEQYQSLKTSMLSKMFPKEGQKQPEIRLDGFEGDWENVVLGDIGNVLMNKRIFKDETSEYEEIPFYKIGTFGKIADSFISRQKFEEYKAKYPYPQIGDILISASGSIGKIVEYKGEDAYFQDSNIVWLNHGGRLSNSFLKQFYQIVKWDGVEGTTIKRLYNKNILNTKISIPSLPEQEAIGAFFANLDETISSYQDKIGQLELLKKNLLSQMFI